MKPKATKIDRKDKSLPEGVSLNAASGGEWSKEKYLLAYGIKCHYLRILDHSKYPWAKSLAYTLWDEAWDSRDLCEKVCKSLEKANPGWMFWPDIKFFGRDEIKGAMIYSKAILPSKPLVDLAREEDRILSIIGGGPETQVPQKPASRRKKKQ